MKRHREARRTPTRCSRTCARSSSSAWSTAGTSQNPARSGRTRQKWPATLEESTTTAYSGTGSKHCLPGCALEYPDIEGRAVADTAPLLERDYARLAGLGWIGKNTMLINRRLGSFTFLGALLVDAELAYDPPHETDHCGSCTRCLDACPTQAFPGPYQLDARRCISYWTIEHRGMLADSESAELHDWVFGCDVCQDVCPWNRKAPPGRLTEFDARLEWTDPDVIEWLDAHAGELEGHAQGNCSGAYEAWRVAAQCGTGAGHAPVA